MTGTLVDLEHMDGRRRIVLRPRPLGRRLRGHRRRPRGTRIDQDAPEGTSPRPTSRITPCEILDTQAATAVAIIEDGRVIVAPTTTPGDTTPNPSRRSSARFSVMPACPPPWPMLGLIACRGHRARLLSPGCAPASSPRVLARVVACSPTASLSDVNARQAFDLPPPTPASTRSP